jgi:hypothetical protein
MRITDDTRTLGVVVSASAWLVRGSALALSVDARSLPPLILYLSCAAQVCRGTAVTMVSPTTGAEEIANPFLAAEEQQ